MPPFRPIPERFWVKVDKNGPVPESRPELGPCWMWTAHLDDGGYGILSGEKRKRTKAHRISYELNVGRIPDGLTIDHLCRNRGCVNPSHLEPVTMKENNLRGNSPAAQYARQTHCKRGHLKTEENTYRWKGTTKTSCLQCKKLRDQQRDHRAERRARKDARV